MVPIATAPLALSVSRAGGLGFLAAGWDVSELESNLRDAISILQTNPFPTNLADKDVLPLGIGFLTWGADLTASLNLIKQYKPAAIWLFGAPTCPSDTSYATWTTAIRENTCTPPPAIFIQTSSVAAALHLTRTVRPDVLVLQGVDAGGHGAVRAASILTLVPEVADALSSATDLPAPLPALVAAGGISDGRTLAATLCLGAAGAVLGTRFLACHEARIAGGYQREILRVSDGGVSTVRNTLNDRLRGINRWPDDYDGRGVVNAAHRDAMAGMDEEENRRLYVEEGKKGDDGWGPEGRMVTWAGTGVGLVREVMGAGEIVEGIRREAAEVLGRKLI